MAKTSKLMYILGSIIIGLSSLLCVYVSVVATGKTEVEVNNKIVLRSASCEKTYDSMPLESDDWELVSGEVKENHILKVDVFGSQTEAGNSVNYISAIIVDENDKDVSSEYTIEYQPGSLNVLRRRIAVKSLSMSKVYDGRKISCDEYELTSGTLAIAQTIDITKAQELTEVGKIQNEIVAVVLDADGNDATDNYEIEYTVGELEILPRQLTIKSETVEKTYDSKSLTSKEYEIVTGELCTGHSIECDGFKTITAAGEIDNTFTAKIADENGEDVTKNYAFDYSFGKLKINKIVLGITTTGAKKEYDGSPLTKKEEGDVTITTGEVVEGQVAKLNAIGTITNAGKINNDCEVSIVSEDGLTVFTHNYTVRYDTLGVLEITKKPITASSNDAKKPYDGTPLTKNEDGDAAINTLTTLVEGHVPTFSITGSRTDVGESDNEFVLTIADATGNDVTANYNITREFGLLTVEKRPVTLESSGAEKIYDDTPLVKNDLLSDVTVKTGGELISLLEGHSVLVEAITGTQTNVGQSYNTFKAKIIDANNLEVTSNYEITSAYGMLTVNPKEITVITEGDIKEYDGTALTKSELTDARIDATTPLVVGHRTLLAAVGAQTEIGESLNGYEIVITNAGGDVVTDNYKINEQLGKLIVTKRAITLKSEGLNEIYNNEEFVKNQQTDVAVTSGSLLDGHNLVSNIVGKQKNVGQSENKFTSMIMSGTDDVSNIYDITYVFGSLIVERRDVIVVSNPIDDVYDGTLHTDFSKPTVSDTTPLPGGIDIDSFANGGFILEGNLTNAGTVDNTILSIRLVDEDGEYVNNNFNISFIHGKITLAKRKITITSDSIDLTYNGEEQEYNQYTQEGLADNQIIDVEFLKFKNVGTYANIFVATILDAGNNDVTANYDIVYKYGTVNITPSEITVASDSDVVEYDGEEYSLDVDADINIINGALLGTDMATYSSNSTITNVGSMTCLFTMNIFNNGENVSKNYLINYNYGTLTVTKKAVTIETDDLPAVYNGQAVAYDNDVLPTVIGLIDTDSIRGEYLAKGPNVGSYDNVFKAQIFNQANENVTSNYEITYNYGTITIAKKVMTVTSQNIEATYDGLAHNNANTTAYPYNYVGAEGGDIPNATYTASLTNAGTTLNTFNVSVTKIIAGRTVDVTNNYQINSVYGTITVKKITVTLVSEPENKVYDGQALETQKIYNYEPLPINCYADFDYDVPLGSQTNVGTSKATFSAKIYLGNTNPIDITDNFNIIYSFGDLVVTKKAITINSKDIVKVYDGIAVVPTDSDYTTTGELAPGDTLSITPQSSLTNAGTVLSYFTYTITNADNDDVTENYNVTSMYGTITITPKVITLTSLGFEARYNGQAQMDESGYVEVDGEVIDADVVPIFYGSQTEIGSSPDAFTAYILSNDGVNVTNNYIILYIFGTITVTP